MGFKAFEYTAGKADWLAHGRPREGSFADVPMTSDLLRDDMVTCSPDDPAQEVRARVEASEMGFALVLNEHRVLLGRVRRSALREQPEASLEELTEPGPSTIRAGEPAEELLERLRELELRWTPVTTPNGVLLGVFDRRRAEERVG